MARKATRAAKKTVTPRKAAVRGAHARPGADASAIEPAGRPLRAKEIEEVFRRFHAASPEPKGELEHKNVFTLLVAVVLSAQATDAGVNKATRPLFATVDTPEKMIALGEERLREAIKTIGLYRMKAKNVIALSEKLWAEHGGVVPRTHEALEALPGVGRKTANVVRNIAFGEATIAVDTHVFRVSNRTGLAPGRNVLEVETALEKRVPAAYKLHAHHWLILHGRYVCKAQRPLCESCLINDICRWPGKATFLAKG
jgi:endonuclease-3